MYLSGGTFAKLCFLQVLVIIDVKPKDLGLPTEAYISVEEVHDVSRLFGAGDKVGEFLGRFFRFCFCFVSHVQLNRPLTL